MSGNFGWLEWRTARELAKADTSFYALIGAAMMRADTFNASRLRSAFPGVWEEVQARYDGPGGYVAADSEALIRNTAGDYADAILAQLGKAS